MNIADWLDKQTRRLQEAGIDTARLDALVLLEDSLGMDRARILGHPEIIIPDDSLSALESHIMRRLEHEPLAYIRGHAEFYGREFRVSHSVLVPRPETEMIIEQLLRLELVPGSSLVDVGTGSGAIAITAKVELPTHPVLAIDIDVACLDIARKNADTHHTDIVWIQGNLIAPLVSELVDDYVLLCNLPYVPDEYAVNQAASHEPHLALYSGADGLDHYRLLFEQIAGMERVPGYVLTESLPQQHAELRRLGQATGYTEVVSADFVQVFRQHA